jgi:hypothetical protein
MKLLQIATVCLLCSVPAWAAKKDDSTAVADSAKVEIAREDGAKKQLIKPQPKTNWSKIKELFM